MPMPIQAKLAPKGLTSNNPLVDNLLGKATAAAGGAVSDVIGDYGGKIGGGIGGTIGSAVGSAVGNAVTGKLSDALGLSDSNVGQQWFQGPADILQKTGGLVFPNTPIIQVGHTANWQDYDLTHTNYAYYGYQNSKVDNITVTGKFTINSKTEADYMIGCLHFLRSVTKMNFGANDPEAGTPPPVLEFIAMGGKAFSKVPVVVANFTSNFEDLYDYVPGSLSTGLGNAAETAVGIGAAAVNGGIAGAAGAIEKAVGGLDVTYVPTTTMLTLTLLPYYNPRDMETKFSLSDFQAGDLLMDGWI